MTEGSRGIEDGWHPIDAVVPSWADTEPAHPWENRITGPIPSQKRSLRRRARSDERQGDGHQEDGRA